MMKAGTDSSNKAYTKMWTLDLDGSTGLPVQFSQLSYVWKFSWKSWGKNPCRKDTIWF